MSDVAVYSETGVLRMMPFFTRAFRNLVTTSALMGRIVVFGGGNQPTPLGEKRRTCDGMSLTCREDPGSP